MLNPEAGGAEVHVHETASRWVREGHEVTLVCSGFKNARREDVLDGIKIRRIGNKHTLYYHIFKLMRDRSTVSDFDVVFESINTIPFLSPLVSKIPIVVQIYSIDNKRVLFRESGLKNLPLAAGVYALSSLIPNVYRNCEVTTISEYSKRRLTERGFEKDRITVAYPGLSPNFLRLVDALPEAPRPNSSIVYLGRLKRYKGVQDIIRSLKILKKTIPNIHLFVIGKGDYDSELKSLTDSLGLADSVTFCGFVSEPEKATLLKSASLYVCTSVDEGGWTISAVEAMSAGLPILVTESQFDVLGDGKNGSLLPSSSPAILAEKIEKILGDETNWLATSRAAAEFSRKFDWNATARIMLNSLENAVARAKKRSSIQAIVSA